MIVKTGEVLIVDALGALKSACSYQDEASGEVRTAAFDPAIAPPSSVASFADLPPPPVEP